VTGSFAQATGAAPGAAVNPFQTIERKDVGLTLKIKPQVSEGGLLKLDIYQEISSVAPVSGTGASDLITNKRSIETKVLVDDGHTIVLGGLIEDNRTESEQSVPFLGRIPFIGFLFKYKKREGKRTNLMVFLRPTILYGPTDTHSVTTDRYQHLRTMNRDKRREPMYERYAPVAPDHKPNKDKDPRRRDDSDTRPAASNKPATPPVAETAPADATPDAPAGDSQ
jgi:general secretion pathway protein D